jgi:hypothetical protein
MQTSQLYLFGGLDSPKDNQVVFGVLDVYGWVITAPSSETGIEITINGAPIHSVRIARTSRPDVAQAYPELAEQNPTPGFSIPLNTLGYPVGTSILKWIAWNTDVYKIIGQAQIQINNCETDLHSLPYYPQLRRLEEEGEILSRTNICGSGPPAPSVSVEAYSCVKRLLEKPSWMWDAVLERI